MKGWRTIVIESPVHLSETDRQLVIKDGKTEQPRVLPLAQIREIFIVHRKTTVTSGLMTVLAAEGIGIAFCDKKHIPCCESVPLDPHNDSAGLIMDQAQWSQTRRDSVWAEIARDKIRVQSLLLSRLGLEIPFGMVTLYDRVNDGDTENCEGQAAKLYFAALFGNGFVRRSVTDINAALNYGYSIILSSFSRIIVSHGYNTALGIHHHSRANRLNLACDIMEPFRPFVDRIVYLNGGRPLDTELKHALVEVTGADCTYNGRSTTLDTAMDCYALDVLKSMDDTSRRIGDVDFEG